MGWVFGAIGAGLGVAFAAYASAERDGATAALSLAAWLANWLLVPALASGVVAMLLLFPTGHLPSVRWRPVGWAYLVGLAAWVLGQMFHPLLLDAGRIPNPLPITLPCGAADAFVSAGSSSIAVVVVAAAVAMVQRFRSARAVERQQLKWFTFAAAITAGGFGSLFISRMAPELDPISYVGWPVGFIGFSFIPVAAGIAILRYRLYGIDRLINRTLVYAALSATLGAAYVGLVIALQGLLSGFARGEGLAVAASTLVVAALFQSARRRIQRAVDRRFYRSKYDAPRILDGFGARLRDEVDLARLTDSLRDAVDQTLQPSSAWVWLRR